MLISSVNKDKGRDRDRLEGRGELKRSPGFGSE